MLLRLIRKYNSLIGAITLINISDTIVQICGFGAFRTVTVIDLIAMMFQKNLDCFLTLMIMLDIEHVPEESSTQEDNELNYSSNESDIRFRMFL